MNFCQRISRKLVLSLVGLVAVVAPAAAQDNYPNQPIHVELGFAAGSGADILTRYFTDKLQGLAKQPVIVDNKPGATGNIALRAVADAKPDGYTLLFSANSNMAGSRYLFKDLPFDTLKDFVPVASFAQIAFVVVVSPKSPLNSIADLTAYLKKKQGALSGYTNQTAQLSTEYYKQLAGVTTTPVAYKATPDAMRDIIEGQLDFMIIDGTFGAGAGAPGSAQGFGRDHSTTQPQPARCALDAGSRRCEFRVQPLVGGLRAERHAATDPRQAAELDPADHPPSRDRAIPQG